ncbi:hypothetical protein [Methylobacterium brachythecii]|uniref:Uncharacterized protein n=1 Tax=Methylobacterium brachythecii TaxID=1176177 RepID=A0A7W6F773_9HYPH|nr:hypothetical protein [Methylobacterium brachythecii]MBB3903079.1 hypothetical protein [Methylobacterium brachythecii]GLS46711.1 hypothetical protein GCM10007884_47050 [Methylobacterium brachythecii]
MSACAPRDPGVETLSAARGSALPFLPTLLTAFAVGLLSLLCSPSSAPVAPAASVVTAEVSPAGADGFHPVLPGSETAPAIPAALAFARLHPLTLHAPQLAETKAPATRSTRSASASRRACTGPRCVETRRLETAVRTPPAKAASEPESAPASMRAQSEADEDMLPTGALPFAATAASWVDRARSIGGSVGNGAASLGGSVVELLASAR